MIKGGQVWAWCLYDWAYSAFNTVITTFVIATYFVQAVATDPATGASEWAFAQSAAGIVIALLAAPLGAIADRGGRRRAMLAGFTTVMVACTAALWFVRPVHADAPLALVLVAGATVAFEIATVFYNAMLPDIAPAGRLGRVSGIAWGLGYAGGLVCLFTCLVLLVDRVPSPFGLDRAQAEQVRATALFAAAWIAIFAWPVVVFVPDRAVRRPWTDALNGGLARLRETARVVWADRTLRRFLIARMLYTDGLTTLFAFGAIYAAGRFGMGTGEVLQLGIALNLTAGLGALGFALVEDRIGARRVILVCVAALTVLGLLILVAPGPRAFWALSLALGVFIGPAQAASRSLMAGLAPAGERNALFGLYALSGRITGFVGPAALGTVTAALHSQQAGMAVIPVLLAAGFVLLAATPITTR